MAPVKRTNSNIRNAADQVGHHGARCALYCLLAQREHSSDTNTHLRNWSCNNPPWRFFFAGLAAAVCDVGRRKLMVWTFGFACTPVDMAVCTMWGAGELDTVVEQDHTHGKCHCATVWTSGYVGDWSDGHLASSERLPRARPAATWSTISVDATRPNARRAHSESVVPSPRLTSDNIDFGHGPSSKLARCIVCRVGSRKLDA